MKETWDAYPPGGDDPWNDHYDYDHDYHHDDDGDSDADPEHADGAQNDYADYELNDLVDDEITLGWWTRPGAEEGEGGGEEIQLSVSYEEQCASTPSKDLKPFRSEYEGFMGNYGNTLDRWYRRSAIVLWPRGRAFAARAEAAPGSALAHLRDRLTSGEPLTAVRADAASLSRFWPHSTPGPETLGTALDVAARLGVPGTAAMLLQPFHAESLTPDHADALTAAAGTYGRQWASELVEEWFRTGSFRHGAAGIDRREWTRGLPQLCEALRHAGGAHMAVLLTDAAWRWLENELEYWSAQPRAEHRRPGLGVLGAALTGVWQACDDGQRTAIAQALRAHPDTVLDCLIPTLRTAVELPAPARDTAKFTRLARDCAGRLEAFLAVPPRTEGDWSISWSGCSAPRLGSPAAGVGTSRRGCDLCDKVAAFLASPTDRVLEWPLAQGGRRHVESLIDTSDLPVRHSTRRQGRPYTLVLTKTDALFTSERQARRTAGTDLTWIDATWPR